MVPVKKPSQQDVPVTSQPQRDPGGTQNNQHNYVSFDHFLTVGNMVVMILILERIAGYAG